MKRFVLTLVVFIVVSIVAVSVALAAGSSASATEELETYEDADRLLELIESDPEDFYLVDTRTREEYVSGHMPGAIHIDYREIGDNPPTQDRDALVIVYCRSGARAGQAEQTLREMGFTRVLNWGGIIDWPHAVVLGPEPYAE